MSLTLDCFSATHSSLLLRHLLGAPYCFWLPALKVQTRSEQGLHLSNRCISRVSRTKLAEKGPSRNVCQANKWADKLIYCFVRKFLLLNTWAGFEIGKQRSFQRKGEDATVKAEENAGKPVPNCRGLFRRCYNSRDWGARNVTISRLATILGCLCHSPESPRLTYPVAFMAPAPSNPFKLNVGSRKPRGPAGTLAQNPLRAGPA